jgi:hypothetical protein
MGGHGDLERREGSVVYVIVKQQQQRQPLLEE